MQFFSCLSCCTVPPENNDIHTLDLGNCYLSDVPQNVLLFERTLETLLLNSNHIRDLPLPLFHCQALQVLNLSNNDLESLPAAIGYLINLKELNISRNGVTHISDSIKKCKKLAVLNASFNPLHHLPCGLTQLISLAELYLNDTVLEYLPANIGRLSKLVILELRGNKLSGLPKSMCRLVCLSRLDIGQNHFLEFPSVIGNLPSIKELWCDLNEFSVVPAFIGQLKELVHFEIGDNNIQTITNDIDGCRNLVDFSACYCDIQFVPHTIGLLKNLLCLKLDYNSMTCLTEAIGGLSNLEELSLSHNKLKTLPSSIGLLRKLVSLHLDSNKLKKLPPELGSCVNLTVLSLRNNQLESVPAELGNIVNLSVLVLSDNRLPYLPISILKLKKLNALWLSRNQSKPLVPLQVDFNAKDNVRVLTCYLLPQQKCEDFSSNATTCAEEKTNSLRRSPKIRFLLTSPNEKVGSLTRAPTPYPKELRNLSKVAQNISHNQTKSSDNPEKSEVTLSLSPASNHNQSVDFHFQSFPLKDQSADTHSNSADCFIKTAVVKKQGHVAEASNEPLDNYDFKASEPEIELPNHSLNYSASSPRQTYSSSGTLRSQLRPPPYHIAATFSKKASLFNQNPDGNQISHTLNKSEETYNNHETPVSHFSDDCRDSVSSTASSLSKKMQPNTSIYEFNHALDKNALSNHYSFVKREMERMGYDDPSTLRNKSQGGNQVSSNSASDSVNYSSNNLGLQNSPYSKSRGIQPCVPNSSVFKASLYVPHSDDSDDNSYFSNSVPETSNSNLKHVSNYSSPLDYSNQKDLKTDIFVSNCRNNGQIYSPKDILQNSEV